MKTYTQLCVRDITETEDHKKILDYLVANCIDHQVKFYNSATVGVYAWVTQDEYNQFIRFMYPNK